MTSITMITYITFAIVHPLSELWRTTSLRDFLNRVYYRSGRDDFPVGRFLGVAGSLGVLAVLLLPLLWDWAWCLALGLVAADLVQHAAHVAVRPGERAPQLHLLTMIGVLVPLIIIINGDRSVLERGCAFPLAGGGGAIFLNWLQNSVRVRMRTRHSGQAAL
jgi:hypothetical protein